MLDMNGEVCDVYKAVNDVEFEVKRLHHCVLKFILKACDNLFMTSKLFIKATHVYSYIVIRLIMTTNIVYLSSLCLLIPCNEWIIH